ILSRLNRLIAEVTRNYDNWQFGEGTRAIYEFLWSEFADWYIEAAKGALNSSDAAAQARTRAILVHTLDQALRLLHPTMPFVTEEVWQHLRKAQTNDEGRTTEEALIIAAWPKADKKLIDARAEKDFAMVMEIVRAIRNARAEINVEPGKRIPAILSAGSAQALCESHRDTLALLARLEPSEFRIEKHAAKPAQSLALVTGKIEVHLPLAGMIDVEKEKARLTNEIAKVNADIARAENLLAGEFSKRAPKDVVQKTRDTLAANRERTAKLDAQLAALEGRAIANPAKETKAAKTKIAKKRAAKKSVKKISAKKTRKRK
ncbi:MAG: class I tRNA ligase family protein, partial [Chloroflexi bacterium]|nr:class I tRNA ligase family protein [Chloroflexota bacterium]